LGGGGEELAEGKGREGDVEDGRVVDGEAEDDANQKKLLGRFERVGVEVAVLRVFVVEEHACARPVSKSTHSPLKKKTYHDPG
jgi:hypothetical protein